MKIRVIFSSHENQTGLRISGGAFNSSLHQWALEAEGRKHANLQALRRALPPPASYVTSLLCRAPAPAPLPFFCYVRELMRSCARYENKILGVICKIKSVVRFFVPMCT
jgi:hypothetical protein